MSYFEAVYTSGKIGFEKPNQHYFEAILNDLHRNRIALMIGDSYERDIEGAMEVGLEAIWVNRIAEDHKVDERVSVIKELAELLEIFGEG